MRIGFDNEKYLREQSQYILERVNNFDKLYLEFGGKLMYDLHAKRVLPGYDENVKVKLLQRLKDQAEIVICVYAGDLERNKMHGDVGLPYHLEVLQLIDNFRNLGLLVNSVVMTRYAKQPAATAFINKLKQRNITVYKHQATKGYPTDVETIVSPEGYGKNPYIETTRPIVVVTGPGPGSGKLGTCLSQLYHEYQRGKVAGYSKFETFPVWNVPLKHPLNVAYEAATADLKDVNLIDNFHLEAYGDVTVNYNRDLEMFPVIKRIIEKITGKDSIYKSPTDMGVNRVGFGIVDDEVVAQASSQEVIRRYFKAAVGYKKGECDLETMERCRLLMEELNLKEEDRACVTPARNYAMTIKKKEHSQDNMAVIATELPNGTVITGKGSELMNCTSAMLLNAVKHLAGIDDDIYLLSPSVLEPVIDLKKNTLHNKHGALNCEDILMMLSICAVTNPVAQVALSKLHLLTGLQAHSTVILSEADLQTLRKLGIDVTCDPIYPTSDLFYQ